MPPCRQPALLGAPPARAEARLRRCARGNLATSDISPSRRSRWALDGVNFFLAGTLAGFGPFVAAFLGELDWSQRDIGFVLSSGAVAALVAQIPGGEILDAVRSKRVIVAVGTLALAAAALLIALRPTVTFVLAGLVLEGITAGFITPAIAAISLGLVGHALLGERLGRNQGFKSAGSLLAAALMGLVGQFVATRAIFFTTAALTIPTFLALAQVHAGEIHFGRSVGAPDHHEPTRPKRLSRRELSRRWHLVGFAAFLFLFQFADASILPLLGGEFGRQQKSWSTLFVSALLVVPQIMVVFGASFVGRRAQTWGRRPLLLAGFVALALRAGLLAIVTNPVLLIVVQTLDGISGMVLGVLTPLVIADLTMGTGRYNLSQGMVGAASGIGAALSTTVSGLIVQQFGLTAGFLEILGAALAACIGVFLFMPETRPAGRESGGREGKGGHRRKKAGARDAATA